MKILRTLDGVLSRIEGIILTFFLVAILVLAFFQVILREAFSSGLIWGDVLARHFVLWIGFLGASIAVSENRHINIEAIKRFIPVRVERYAGALTDLFAAAVCGYLASAALTFISQEFEAVTVLFGPVRAWHGQLIIPVGFTLLAIHFAIRMVLHFSGEKIREALV
jgi:TRAP-type C4-dicarboxylate transport system permease small subunit